MMGRRICMSVLGVVICGVSVGMFRYAALGVDPFQSLMSGLDALIPLRFGTLYVIVNLILLLFAALLDRRKLGLATLINLFLLGYIAEFFQALLTGLHPAPGLILRLGVLIAAVVIMCLASALYYTADLGVSTYDAAALIWSQRQSRISFPVCRVICDLCCVALGLGLCAISGMAPSALPGVVGVGTVITAFFMGPLIQFFRIRLAEPLLKAGSSQDPS